jgi:hypothetical protein
MPLSHGVFVSLSISGSLSIRVYNESLSFLCVFVFWYFCLHVSARLFVCVSPSHSCLLCVSHPICFVLYASLSLCAWIGSEINLLFIPQILGHNSVNTLMAVALYELEYRVLWYGHICNMTQSVFMTVFVPVLVCVCVFCLLCLFLLWPSVVYLCLLLCLSACACLWFSLCSPVCLCVFVPVFVFQSMWDCVSLCSLCVSMFLGLSISLSSVCVLQSGAFCDWICPCVDLAPAEEGEELEDVDEGIIYE